MVKYQHKYFWNLGVEEQQNTGYRYFGVRVFAFGTQIYLGKRSWLIRVAIRT